MKSTSHQFTHKNKVAVVGVSGGVTASAEMENEYVYKQNNVHRTRKENKYSESQRSSRFESTTKTVSCPELKSN